MKSFGIILFFILVNLVIISEASTEQDFREAFVINDGGFKVWLNDVNGYDENDPKNGYSGIFGKEVTSLSVSGGKVYRVHILGGGWLNEITGYNHNDFFNGYAGTHDGDPIDAVVIDGDDNYSVHILGEDWLPPITGYDYNNLDHYCGIFGKPIDAIMIENRVYSTSYLDSCDSRGGTCIHPLSCTDGEVLTGYCPGGAENKCCVPYANSKNLIYNPNNNTNNSTNSNQNNNTNNSNNGFNSLYILIMILSILSFIIIALVIYFILSKQFIKSFLKNLPSLNNNSSSNNNNNNNNNNNEEQPPSYFDIVNEEATESQRNLLISSSSSTTSSTSTSSSTPSSLINRNCDNQNQEKEISNNSLIYNAYPATESSHNEKKETHSTVKRPDVAMVKKKNSLPLKYSMNQTNNKETTKLTNY